MARRRVVRVHMMYEPFGGAAMGILRRGFVWFCLVGVCFGVVAGSAQAQGAERLSFKVAPATLLSSAPVHVSFVADGRLPRGWRYVVLVNGGVNTQGMLPCVVGARQIVKGLVRRGQRIVLDIRPLPAAPLASWCAGRVWISVIRVDVEGHRVPVASQKVNIVADPARPAFIVPQRASIRALDGSSLTVHAPGRPDHVIGLEGLIVGDYSNKPKPNTDVTLGPFTGSLSATTFTPDPLCLGPSYLTGFPVKADSSAVLATSGHATLRLSLAASPSALAGCATASGGDSVVTLEGQVGPGGLLNLPLTGSIANVPVDGGSVDVKINAKIDLSGNP